MSRLKTILLSTLTIALAGCGGSDTQAGPVRTSRDVTVALAKQAAPFCTTLSLSAIYNFDRSAGSRTSDFYRPLQLHLRKSHHDSSTTTFELRQESTDPTPCGTVVITTDEAHGTGHIAFNVSGGPLPVTGTSDVTTSGDQIHLITNLVFSQLHSSVNVDVITGDSDTSGTGSVMMAGKTMLIDQIGSRHHLLPSRGQSGFQLQSRIQLDGHAATLLSYSSAGGAVTYQAPEGEWKIEWDETFQTTLTGPHGEHETAANLFTMK